MCSLASRLALLGTSASYLYSGPRGLWRMLPRDEILLPRFTPVNVKPSTSCADWKLPRLYSSESSTKIVNMGFLKKLWSTGLPVLSVFSITVTCMFRAAYMACLWFLERMMRVMIFSYALFLGSLGS